MTPCVPELAFCALIFVIAVSGAEVNSSIAETALLSQVKTVKVAAAQQQEQYHEQSPTFTCCWWPPPEGAKSQDYDEGPNFRCQKCAVPASVSKSQCTNGRTGTWCPQGEVTVPKPCCTDDTLKCIACAEKMTPEEYCDRSPGANGCFCLSNPDHPGCPPCCTANTVGCLACAEGISHKRYCQQNAFTFGCPLNPKKCCTDFTAKCLACREGITLQQICAQAPGVSGCEAYNKPGCCSGFTARCLACAEGIPQQDLCKDYPDTPGCSCCEALTAECLACFQGVTEEQYCQDNPGTAGCPTPKPTAPPGGWKNSCKCGCGWLLTDDGLNCDKCARRCRRANKLSDYKCTSQGPWRDTRNCNCQWMARDNCRDCNGCATECRAANPNGPCGA